MALGENLQRIRKAKGLRQDQLAEKAGVSVTQISKIERNETDPRVSTIEKLASVLGCSADKLLFDRETETLDGMMKAAFERASGLKPKDKGILLTVIHKYCSASIMMRELAYGMEDEDEAFEDQIDEIESQAVEEMVYRDEENRALEEIIALQPKRQAK